ncbi:hypothetical protein GCM10017691_47420 [Pseudonocardia petroleophila]|uniref:O-antigen ligase n=1 Tax=Pseudonocardia petroleophila TaxID=37331 RepID=A0A7G7MQK6_9PSEU|nr:hypothetical protein [Pseudonocardia petroleophila]QNG55067.1 hypothetical protein H6H00_15075 [Pseudonocardia petroleophila]
MPDGRFGDPDGPVDDGRTQLLPVVNPRAAGPRAQPARTRSPHAQALHTPTQGTQNQGTQNQGTQSLRTQALRAGSQRTQSLRTPHRRPGSPPAVPRRISRIAERVPLASVYLLIVTITLFQRFVVPGTVVSIALPIAFVVLVGLAARGQLVADVTRVALYLAAVAASLLCTVIVSAGSGPAPSFTSLLLLLVLYIPLCFRVSDRLRDQFPRVLEFFQRIMIVGAVFCLLQTAVQLAGISYTDLFDTYLPPQLIFTEYNTTYPIYYGSPILKANGFVFLEPSFASQFLAIAIIIQLMVDGKRWGRLALFGGALLATVSGTGIALLGVGLVVLAIRRGGRWTARALTAAFLVGLAVSLTPVGALLAERTGESSTSGSSGNARFVAPYVVIADAIGRDESVFLVGRGAGTVDSDVQFFNPTGLLVNYPALPKFIGEYGVPTALVFLTFILTVLLRNVPSPTLGLMAATVYFVLSGSLLQPQTVYLCWLLTGLFAAARAGEIAGRRVRLSSAVAPVERRLLPPGPVAGVPGPRLAAFDNAPDRTMAVPVVRRPAPPAGAPPVTDGHRSTPRR